MSLRWPTGSYAEWYSDFLRYMERRNAQTENGQQDVRAVEEGETIPRQKRVLVCRKIVKEITEIKLYRAIDDMVECLNLEIDEDGLVRSHDTTYVTDDWETIFNNLNLGQTLMNGNVMNFLVFSTDETGAEDLTGEAIDEESQETGEGYDSDSDIVLEMAIDGDVIEAVPEQADEQDRDNVFARCMGRVFGGSFWGYIPCDFCALFFTLAVLLFVALIAILCGFRFY